MPPQLGGPPRTTTGGEQRTRRCFCAARRDVRRHRQPGITTRLGARLLRAPSARLGLQPRYPRGRPSSSSSGRCTPPSHPPARLLAPRRHGVRRPAHGCAHSRRPCRLLPRPWPRCSLIGRASCGATQICSGPSRPASSSRARGRREPNHRPRTGSLSSRARSGAVAGRFRRRRSC